MKQLPLVLRLLLGGFLIFMGVKKLLSLDGFVEAVANYQMLDRPHDEYVAYFVPWVEFFTGLAIATGVLLRGGLLVSILMMIGFTTAVIVVWNQGLNINCGCYGVSDKPSNYPLVVTRNVFIFIVSVGLFWTAGRSERRLAA
ncbi:MAG: MauE/DoxX family redox-associated membrane protein [Akkermansiaceae bacterium]